MTKNIFKKSIFTLLLGIIITLNSLPLVVQAAPGDPPATPPSGDTDVANPTEDQLLQQFKYKDTSAADTAKTKIGAVNALPHNTWQAALTGLVNILLNIAGALTLLALTVGGVFMITAHGSTDMLDKGKKIVLYAIGGLIVIAVSYAIVIGVSSLQFFTPGTPGTTGAGAPAAGTATTPNQPTPGEGKLPGDGGGLQPPSK